MSDFARVLRDVNPKLDGVTREDLAGGALLGPPAQTLAVDERPVTTLSVLQVELASLVIKPDQGMVP